MRRSEEAEVGSDEQTSGLSHDQTRTLPVSSALATQKPLGLNFATVTGALCPRYTKHSAGFSRLFTMTKLPEP